MTLRGMLFAVLILSCLIAIGQSQFPCCGPDQWQAGVIGTEGEYNRDQDAASLSYVQSKLFYDYTNRQMAVRRHVDNQTVHKITDETLIMKYSMGKMYRIIGQNCTSEDIPKMMDPPCIPDGSAYFGSHAYPYNVMVDVWLISDKMSGGQMRMAVTKDTCLRVSMSHLSGGADYWLTMNTYVNVTKGIEDSSVFDVPSFCPKFQTVLRFQGHQQVYVETADTLKDRRGLLP